MYFNTIFSSYSQKDNNRGDGRGDPRIWVDQPKSVAMTVTVAVGRRAGRTDHYPLLAFVWRYSILKLDIRYFQSAGCGSIIFILFSLSFKIKN